MRFRYVVMGNMFVDQLVLYIDPRSDYQFFNGFYAKLLLVQGDRYSFTSDSFAVYLVLVFFCNIRSIFVSVDYFQS